jgi:hypothetical protein
VATPFLRVPVPRTEVPSIKVTLPVGVPADDGLLETLAVNVTERPLLDGLDDDPSDTDDVALFTVWVKTADVLASNLELPPYLAVMEWVPAERLVVL